MYKMRNLLKIFGLFLLLSTAYGSFNLYLNEHETMRLLGKLKSALYFMCFLYSAIKIEVLQTIIIYFLTGT